MTTERLRSQRGRGSALRGEIVVAAIALLDRTQDPSRVTLRGVAREVGITPMSIYAHFLNVEAMMDALLEVSFDELAATVRGALEARRTPRAALLAGAAAYVQFGWDHPGRYRLMFAASGFAPNAIHTFRLIEDTIARCAATGSSSSRDAHQDTFLLWAGLHGLATLEKPARPDYRRLGPLDRPASVAVMTRRLARLT